ncbi:spore germination protein [Mechercharimyces sp. CAU 1602]|uniref:spore germination protein n=1 Tax=Mechercharimyces sp. CAU 1602 TaxID=2973933 RepID=UPI0021629A11|nr:spore germination protein [Mechercharimyces sp. CAU 1602]MCS1351393.1 spore germination protein [Mechercharimyces sp. CAU 1602]
MANRFIRPIKLKDKRKKEELQRRSEQKIERRVKDRAVSKQVKENTDFITHLLGDGADVIVRSFTIQYQPDRKAALVYLDGMADVPLVDKFVLSTLMTKAAEVKSDEDLETLIAESLVQTGETQSSPKMKDMMEAILSGDAALFIDEYEEGIVVGAKGFPVRSVSEPSTEAVVRGPREAFTESIRVNTALIRRRLKDPDLRIKDVKVGKRTRTNVEILYLDGVTDKGLLDEVLTRIENIEIDGILESGYIEELIQDDIWTPFPQLQNTQRPDGVVSHLLEGKVAIVVDGTPHVLIAPAVFSQFYYSPEDYYERYLISSFLRGLRLISLFIAMLLPSLYIAFVSFHPEMIPTRLGIAMAAGRATVPFPSIVEALAMEISVEILREASIRLPGPIGPTIGIVGALVIGDAAVSAGVVSPIMVIVVGLTTISSYANPSYNAAISVRLLRFPFMLAAAVLGLYGIILALMVTLLHLVKLRSFGVPYMAPFAPFRWEDVKDSLVRVPWPWMKKRPTMYKPQDQNREGEHPK